MILLVKKMPCFIFIHHFCDTHLQPQFSTTAQHEGFDNDRKIIKIMLPGNKSNVE